MFAYNYIKLSEHTFAYKGGYIMKLKIKNKIKFITSTSVLFIIIIFIALSTLNVTLSHTEFQYKQMAVLNGDTLWSIACNEEANNQFYHNKDIRYIVDDIKSHNNLTTSSLQVGQTLYIPTF